MRATDIRMSGQAAPSKDPRGKLEWRHFAPFCGIHFALKLMLNLSEPQPFVQAGIKERWHQCNAKKKPKKHPVALDSPNNSECAHPIKI